MRCFRILKEKSTKALLIRLNEFLKIYKTYKVKKKSIHTYTIQNLRTRVWVVQLCHDPLFVCHEIKLSLQSCITAQFYDVKLSETVQQQWQDISSWKRILNVVSFNTCPSVTHTTRNWTFEDCAPFPARHTFTISVG